MSNLWTTLFPKVCHDGPALYSFVRTRVLGLGCQTPCHCHAWKPALVHINMGRVRASPRWLKIWFSTAQGADSTRKVVQKLQETSFPPCLVMSNPIEVDHQMVPVGMTTGQTLPQKKVASGNALLDFLAFPFLPLWVHSSELFKLC